MKPQSNLRTVLHCPDWEDYALLDSGDGAKLERFGPYTFSRPEPEAMWARALPASAWQRAHATFEPHAKGTGGRWRVDQPLPKSWPMRYKALRFTARLTRSRHLGVFPENAVHWDWLAAQIRAADRPIRALNLFAYTGLASLAAAEAGARVTHVDSAKRVVTWARENQALSGLDDRPIRWLVDDALKFVAREGRRGKQYEAIVLDPPKFGRGPKGEVWEFFAAFDALCAACREILSPDPLCVVLTAYATGAQLADLERAIAGMMAGHGGQITGGDLVTREESAGRELLNALSVRWSAR